jgi:hypothetical protein
MEQPFEAEEQAHRVGLRIVENELLPDWFLGLLWL